MKVALRDSKSPPRCRVVLLAEKERPRGEDAALGGVAKGFVERAVKERMFQGNVGEVRRLLLPPRAGAGSLVLLGLGAEKKLDTENLRRAFGCLARQAVDQEFGEVVLSLESPGASRRLKKLGCELALRAIVEGWHLGGYTFERCKSGPGRRRRATRLVLEPRTMAASERSAARRAVRAGEAVARAVNFARDVSNMPGNLLYPETLAARARAMARSFGLRSRVLGKPEIRRRRMGGILGVAQGSARPPRLIELQYRPPGRGMKTLVFVGKAVTFDSGGISIKPARGMQDMKYDMAGGAAVLGAMQALSVLKPRLRAVAVIPAAENLISGSATRPGDVLESASGKTIEVINTDAEGRLLLADALHYARRFRPDAVVDVATLTGACVVALGNRVSGMVANDRAFGRRVLKASASCGERVWELPLFEESFDAVKSKVADLKNSAGRDAGAITAAAFLASFVEGIPWAHLDIAGTGWSGRTEGYNPAGASGVGVRLLAELGMSFADGR